MPTYTWVTDSPPSKIYGFWTKKEARKFGFPIKIQFIFEIRWAATKGGSILSYDRQWIPIIIGSVFPKNKSPEHIIGLRGYKPFKCIFSWYSLVFNTSRPSGKE